MPDSYPARFAVLLMLLLNLSVCRISFAQEVPIVNPEEVGFSSEKLNNVDAAIEKLVDEQKIAGMVFVVARQGKIVKSGAYGLANVESAQPMTEDTIFRIYSMTKPVIAAGAMILHDQGKLDLDSPVSDYLPSFANVTLHSGGKPQRLPTVRDLLRQTAGYTLPYCKTPLSAQYDAALNYNDTLADNVNRFADIPLLYEPGTEFSYGVALDIAAAIIEVVSGQPIDIFLKANIFDPLDMVDTGYFVPPEKLHRLAAIHTRDGGRLQVTQPFDRPYDRDPIYKGGGLGLVSTARDYLRFALMLQNGGSLFGTRILSSESVAKMTRNQLPDPSMRFTLPPNRGKYSNVYIAEEQSTLSDTGYGYGLAVTVEESGILDQLGDYWHGGAASTGFSVSPKTQIVIIRLRQFLPGNNVDAGIRKMVFEAILPEPVRPDVADIPGRVSPFQCAGGVRSVPRRCIVLSNRECVSPQTRRRCQTTFRGCAPLISLVKCCPVPLRRCR